MKELATEIEIQASPKQVWQALTDFKRFSQWNPFIESAKGEFNVGSHVEILVHPPDSSAMRFCPRRLKVEPNRELRRLGTLLIAGLFDAEHTFTIESVAANKVRF